ncbi:MAG: UDP-N-acetylmuramate:L-alanyl-gamma-D-glutamyl-meso-diaminopimelate ligase [Candidatus Parabeggiatoa sp. nov. 1]|nr:MAG: UDP-N-acetylmuramate:L-alanyl-gamma-D-glutamyl-meso-diaminopimelate ligase [Gammaproteobacteria bacterium]
MHVHILGICGTFMAGIAVLAKELGYMVTGSDATTYPPMSTQLEALGIECRSGYLAEHLEPPPDCVVIGNALSRGNPEVEAVLNRGLPYISGPQWLAEHVLANRWVLAVAGTHGKTTASSMLAWILEQAGRSPGFLIGGVPENFGVSARLGEEWCLGKKRFFVVEADEYDTAFFDKRSKFVHYRPCTLVLNNLEFDHADIFSDLAAIQRQFHHLIRTVPSKGLIIHQNQQVAIEDVLAQGCWTPRETIGDANSDWYAKSLTQDNSYFEVWYKNKLMGEVKWDLIGQYNVHNALAAIASTHHVDVPVAYACEALGKFQHVKRRLELRGVVNGISVYDDFAHHPTAIAVTLEALRQRVGQQKIIAVLEPRSNTMRMGIHKDTLASALMGADAVVLYQPNNLNWALSQVANSLHNGRVFNQVEALIGHLVATARSGDYILIMSNGGFENIHHRLLAALTK